MKKIGDYRGLRPWLVLWSTQSLSALGSAMTNFALVVWLYQKSGSALETALLSVCSYAPYVAMSIFAGALSDRWNKRRTMLVCDLLAALCTVTVLLLLRAAVLRDSAENFKKSRAIIRRVTSYFHARTRMALGEHPGIGRRLEYFFLTSGTRTGFFLSRVVTLPKKGGTWLEQ